MQIELTQEGGVAYLPGLSKPRTVDTDRLPPGEAEQLERLVTTAGFFDLPARVGRPKPGAADYRTYTIAVRDAGRAHTVAVVEPIEDPNLQALIGKLRELTTPGA